MLGADDGGEAALTYTLGDETGHSAGGAATFSANGTNASKNTTATFSKAGSYIFQVTIKDAGNLTVTSNVTVTVNATLTTILVSPTSANVGINGTQAFTASAHDQFNAAWRRSPQSPGRCLAAAASAPLVFSPRARVQADPLR